MAIFDNGSRWLKADFHLHTKADSEFPYNNDENAFVQEYIDMLDEASISIGVITNHNKFDKKEFKALKKKARQNDIGLFAGVEFSIKEGFHILIVFDDEWYQGKDNHIQAFLDSAFLGISNYDIPPYKDSKYDLDETVKTLNEFGHDYFLCLAHIDDNNGIHNVLRGRTYEQFVEQEAFKEVLAVQKSGNAENYKRLCKLAGRDIACVEGSDNASKGLSAIGKAKRVAYLKIGDYNFEALKYSLSDHPNRVRPKIPPKINNSYIKSISITGGLLDGVSLNFSPELNTLIGIRGSGKSAILEILRYSLGIELSENSIDTDYKESLVQYVLKSGGKATIIVVNKHGEEYKIEKILRHKEDISKDGKPIDVNISAFFKRPVYFGQKDLSNKDIDFEGDLIDRLIGENLQDYRDEIDLKASELNSIITNYKALSNLEERKAEVEKNIKDAEHKLQVFKDKGVEKKLEKQTQFDKDKFVVNETHEKLVEYYNELCDCLEEHSDIFEMKPVMSYQAGKKVFDKFLEIFDKIKEEQKVLEQSHSNLSDLLDEMDKIVKKYEAKENSLKDEFAEIKREIDVPNLDPDEFLKIKQNLNKDKSALSGFEKAEEQRQRHLIDMKSKMKEMEKAWHEEYQQLLKQIKVINESDTDIEIEIEYKGRKDLFLDEIKNMCRSSGIRAAAYATIAKEYTDFVQIFRDSKKIREILNDNQSTDFLNRLYDNLEDLLTYQVENKFTIKYKSKPLAKHSLGQRASALILFLLAQKDCDVLIIDQPEDDLDSQTIYRDVIKELKSLKGNMQFIFATHNANIPVLGDAEKVVACNFSESEIEVDAGNVDVHSSQNKIVDVMEGGKDAFEQRKMIYGLWRVN